MNKLILSLLASYNFHFCINYPYTRGQQGLSNRLGVLIISAVKKKSTVSNLFN